MKNDFSHIFTNWLIDIPANIFIIVQLCILGIHIKENISLAKNRECSAKDGNIEDRLNESVSNTLFSFATICFWTFFKPNVIIMFTISSFTLIMNLIFFLIYKCKKSKKYIIIITIFSIIIAFALCNVMLRISEYFVCIEYI